MHHKNVKTTMLHIRIDARTKADLQKFAHENGLTTSSFVLTNIRQILYNNEVRIHLKGQTFDTNVLKLRRKRLQADDFVDSIKWSEIDAEN